MRPPDKKFPEIYKISTRRHYLLLGVGDDERKYNENRKGPVLFSFARQLEWLGLFIKIFL